MTKKFLKLLLIFPVIAGINTVKAAYVGQPSNWYLEKKCGKTTHIIGLLYKDAGTKNIWGVHKYNKWNGSSKWIKRNVDEAKARAKYYSRC